MDFKVEDEENDEVSEYSGPYKPSYVLIAIDTHNSMFKSDGAPSPFKNCLLAAYRLCDELLLKSDKRGYSPFAIILHDNDEKMNLINFQDNMIQTTKLLKELRLLSENQLKAKYMRDYDVELTSFFQSCKKKFKDISTNFYKRILLFITNDPDPVNGDKNKRFTALNEAKNFQENDIVFQVIVPNEDFNFDVFYSELFSLLPQKPLNIICEDEEGVYDKLSSTICLKLPQRKMCFYPFADDLTKYMYVYKKSYIKYPRLLNNDFMAEDGTSVIRTRRANPENDEGPQNNQEFILQNADTKHKFHELIFDLGDKLESRRNEFPIGYTLLYVSHRLTSVGEVIGEPKIVETDPKEELPYFNEFWQYCVNNQKVLVCAKKMTASDDPRAVEFIPKLINTNKVFLVKQIPFADEIEEPEEAIPRDEIPATQKQIEVTDRLIDQLSVDFSCSYLVDLEYMRKEWYLKSKLLSEPRGDVEPTEHFTLEQMDQKLNGIVEEYLSAFPQERGTKRKKN
ncbi:hypothetical protein WA026_013525 [Henosepilachna vigintioctopunctata]|uniref:Ku70/Ku80 N-terminal alpha/beta domain-containing protein n=1 Tax=Henosepilachna vigintioctopunctata TaxID=420089 RepID=A0AAW1VC50_9CUCU